MTQHDRVADGPARGRAPGTRTAVLVAIVTLLVAVLGALIWGATVPYSQEWQTELGPMPIDSQDEVRVTGAVWLSIGLALVGLVVSLVWWYAGPRRGPRALGLLALLCMACGGAALLAYNLVVHARVGSPKLVEGSDYNLLFSVFWAPPVLLPALVAVTCYTILTIGTRRDDLVRDRDTTGANTGRSSGVTQHDAAPVVGLSGDHDRTQPGSAGLDGRS